MFKRDLEFLLKEKYGYSDSELILLFHKSEPEKIDKVLAPDIAKDIKQLKAGCPVSYLIGHIDFINAKVDLSQKCLIPRPETEYWVEKVLKSDDFKEKHSILDIFAGSGCIGISALLDDPNRFVVFADKSPKCIRQIEINLELNNISPDQYELVKSDMFKKLKDAKFDVIFANPPYVSNKEQLDKSLKYEPKEALFAGETGMDLIVPFLSEAQAYLEPNGLIFMEFGADQQALIDEELKKIPKYQSWKFYKDQFGKDRWMRIQGF